MKASPLWLGFREGMRAILYLLSHPQLFVYIVLPILGLLTCICGVSVILWFVADDLHATLLSFSWFQPPVPDASWWRTALWTVYEYTSYGLIWILGLLVSYGLGIIIAPTLSEPISEAVLNIEGWSVPEDAVGLRWYQQIAESIVISFVYYILVVCIFLLGIIPILGLMAPIIGFVCTCMFLAKEIIDVPLARYGFPLSKKIQIMKTNKGLFLGFGISIFVMALVPFYNLLLFPIAVIAATHLVHSQKLHGMDTEDISIHD